MPLLIELVLVAAEAIDAGRVEGGGGPVATERVVWRLPLEGRRLLEPLISTLGGRLCRPWLERASVLDRVRAGVLSSAKEQSSFSPPLLPDGPADDDDMENPLDPRWPRVGDGA